jgi:hypothetical protein
VLEEQTLQMAFAPEGGADRRRLGSLLKADILVILHARGTDEVRSLEIVIAETKTGLRVLTDIVSWDEKDPSSTVTAIVDVVKKGLLKSSETTRMIAAVPPFVSDDLSHQYDSMQAAYAELVGQVLSRAPGVHLVELAEARSIGEELRLTDDGSVVRPLQPCYFLGRYRNTGVGEKRTVHLSLEVKQGGGCARIGSRFRAEECRGVSRSGRRREASFV